MFGKRGAESPVFGIKRKPTFLGKKHTSETKKILSEIAKKRPPSFLGKSLKPEAKAKISMAASNRSEACLLKLREKRVAFIEAHGGNKSFNLCACSVFSLMDSLSGWEGQHAKNKGEKIVAGYYLDYFNEKEKIIIEWDEKGHFYGDRIKRDTKKTKVLADLFCDGWIIIRWDAHRKRIREHLSVFNGREKDAKKISTLLTIY